MLLLRLGLLADICTSWLVFGSQLAVHPQHCGAHDRIDVEELPQEQMGPLLDRVGWRDLLHHDIPDCRLQGPSVYADAETVFGVDGHYDYSSQ